MSPQPPATDTWHSGQLGPPREDTTSALETWGDLGSDAILGLICLALVYVILQIVTRKRSRP